ncbi:unnamed protein product [Toxocara canis]|uniref:Epimerase domain-containing protein n=1 Tax=Toxocara canis TaxID=6265 RepID=A0A183V8A3_TOXCA|nr:unnamed protein product [Toxocara canis]
MVFCFSEVLVTGAAGYLAIHCVQQLLNEGYRVRGTVRDTNNTAKVKPLIDLKGSDRLELITADLMDKQIWSTYDQFNFTRGFLFSNVMAVFRAVEGCEYVLHIASPCQTVADDSIIQTAIDGTLNVLRAVAKCDTVKKVVLTSSSGAVNQGHKKPHKLFNEDDWTKLEDGRVYVHKYHVSKTMAEQAAWNFVRNETGKCNFKHKEDSFNCA